MKIKINGQYRELTIFEFLRIKVKSVPIVINILDKAYRWYSMSKYIISDMHNYYYDDKQYYCVPYEGTFKKKINNDNADTINMIIYHLFDGYYKNGKLREINAIYIYKYFFELIRYAFLEIYGEGYKCHNRRCICDLINHKHKCDDIKCDNYGGYCEVRKCYNTNRIFHHNIYKHYLFGEEDNLNKLKMVAKNLKQISYEHINKKPINQYDEYLFTD